MKFKILLLLLFIALVYGATNYYEFGDNVSGGDATPHAINRIYYVKIVTTSDMLLDSAYVYPQSAMIAGTIKVGLYTDSGGSGPDAFIDSATAEVSSYTPNTWVGWKFSKDTTILAGTYWLGRWFDNNVNINFAKGAGGSDNFRSEGLTYGAWPATSGVTVGEAFINNDTYITGYDYGQTYHIDPDYGSDDNAGYAHAPLASFDSINTAGITMLANDTIMIRTDATVRGQLTIPRDSIYVTAYDSSTGATGSSVVGADPIIDGSDLVDGWVNIAGDKHYIAGISTETNLVVLDGVIGTLAANYGAVDAEGEWFWSGDTLYTYAADTSNIYYAQRTPVIDDNNQDYITVEYLTVQNSNGTGVYSDGENNIFDNLTVRRHPTIGIDVDDSDITVSNNTITYSLNGIDGNAGAAPNLIVEGNNVSLSITTAQNRGIYIAGSSGVEVRYNWVHDLDNATDDGIRSAANGCSLYYNIVSNIGDDAVHLADADNCFVLNNSIYIGGDNGLLIFRREHY